MTEWRAKQRHIPLTFLPSPASKRTWTAADRFRASYGGPKPPQIDHQGTDDAMLEKASEVYYWYQGQWRKLTGAD